MPKKIYIVTSGEYSDYNIEKVFTKKRDANVYVSLHTSDRFDDVRVEEYPLDDVSYEGQKIKKVFCAFAKICLDEGANVLSLSEINHEVRHYLSSSVPKSYIKETSGFTDMYGRKIIAYVDVYSCKDKQHAERILFQKFQTYTQQLLEDGRDAR